MYLKNIVFYGVFSLLLVGGNIFAANCDFNWVYGETTLFTMWEQRVDNDITSYNLNIIPSTSTDPFVQVNKNNTIKSLCGSPASTNNGDIYTYIKALNDKRAAWKATCPSLAFPSVSRKDHFNPCINSTVTSPV